MNGREMTHPEMTKKIATPKLPNWPAAELDVSCHVSVCCDQKSAAWQTKTRPAATARRASRPPRRARTGDISPTIVRFLAHLSLRILESASSGKPTCASAVLGKGGRLGLAPSGSGRLKRGDRPSPDVRS